MLGLSKVNDCHCDFKMLLSELECKNVIDVSCGKDIGYVIDLDIDVNLGKIVAIIVKPPFKISDLLNKEEKTVVLWEQIVRIGDDVIIISNSEGNPKTR